MKGNNGLTCLIIIITTPFPKTLGGCVNCKQKQNETETAPPSLIHQA